MIGFGQLGQAPPSVGTMELLREQIEAMTAARAAAWLEGYTVEQLAQVDHHLAELKRTLGLFSSQFKAIPADAVSDVTWAMGEALSALRDMTAQGPAGPPRTGGGGVLQAGVGGLGLLLSLGFMLFRGRRSSASRRANPRRRRRN